MVAPSTYITVILKRMVDEANNDRVDIAAIDVAVFLDPPRVVETPAGKRYVQDGVLRVRPGSDLGNGDEIDLPEGTFGVVGTPQMNRSHSLTGTAGWWPRYQIRKGG